MIKRDDLKLLAMGKYIALKRTFNQEELDCFVEGAMFASDYLSAKERDAKLNKEVKINETTTIENLD